MTDIVDPETRSRMMSGIRGKNTKIEVLVRKGLFARGFRYRINDKKLPGRPDIVLPKYKAVIFTHGCFWHGHDCSLFRLPATNREFWENKIQGNIRRDEEVKSLLLKKDWRIFSIWECTLRGKNKKSLDLVLDVVEEWIKGNTETGSISGVKNGSD